MPGGDLCSKNLKTYIVRPTPRVNILATTGPVSREKVNNAAER